MCSPADVSIAVRAAMMEPRTQRVAASKRAGEIVLNLDLHGTGTEADMGAAEDAGGHIRAELRRPRLPVVGQAVKRLDDPKHRPCIRRPAAETSRDG